MGAPITVEELTTLDFVLCTHHHGDHLDLPALGAIARKFPKARFVVPAGIESEMAAINIAKSRVIWAEDGCEVCLTERSAVTPVKAAHEEFECDQRGRHRFLGYAVHVGNHSVYHSGDTVPYEGLASRIRALRPQLALLPVNGRRKELSERKIAGNFTLGEAIQLCIDAEIPSLIAHHFGMFAFNTIDPALIDQAGQATSSKLRVLKAETGIRYIIEPTRCA
jgi:L-ascorbate metabolism protein UlaG (beta-lactamase superfamily)